MVHKTDIWTLRSLHRTNPPIVGLMHIPDFKAGSFASESSRPHRRKPSFVLELRQRIDLVHKLGKLGGGKKFFDGRGHWTGIDELPRNNCREVAGAHPVLDISRHSREPRPEFVLHQFTDTAHPAVS